MAERPELTFGPVPSRRLGRSLGINNIPPKICSYSCVYCQIGVTRALRVKRRSFYPATEIVNAVSRRVEELRRSDEPVDYLTFVPDGEPTLDLYLGWELWQLSGLGIRTAVITNASLLQHDDVREDLSAADWVSVKVDSVRPDTWNAVNRPHESLHLDHVLDGIREFARDYPGRLVTETMLVRNMNDRPDELAELAQFIGELAPDRAYLAVPTRPPAVAGVRPPSEQTMTNAFAAFKRHVDSVEYLVGYEGNAFATTGDAEADLLSITAVHPMKLEAVCEVLARAQATWSLVEDLLLQGALVETVYGGDRFFSRAFGKRAQAISRSALGAPGCPWLE